MLRVSSYTFGCKLNQSETDAALALLNSYQIVDWDAGADLYLINTCTVTTKGEQKARRLIRQVQKLWPQASILVAGCYAILERERLEALGERVCVVPDQPAQICALLAEKPVANGDELLDLLRSSIPLAERQLQAETPRKVDFPAALMQSHKSEKATAPNLSPSPKKRQRYFLKIQDGCNRTCSFCRIRLARGPSRSLPLPKLIEQLQGLEAEGYSEAVITGVHINSYHSCDAVEADAEPRNQSENETESHASHAYLGDLLLALLEHSQYIRLRLSSLEPEDLRSQRAKTLFRALASRRICPHFHISLQSGSEHVLRQMRRSYTAAQQLSYIQELKRLHPQAFLSCDVIVGFPGESEEDFAATLRLLEELEFSAVHAFSYSPRPGTEAWNMPKVQNGIVKQRMTRLQTLAEKLHKNYLALCSGQEAQVLLEEQQNGYWTGYSENYVRTKISAPPNADWQAGDLIQVQLQINPEKLDRDGGESGKGGEASDLETLETLETSEALEALELWGIPHDSQSSPNAQSSPNLRPHIPYARNP